MLATAGPLAPAAASRSDLGMTSASGAENGFCNNQGSFSAWNGDRYDLRRGNPFSSFGEVTSAQNDSEPDSEPDSESVSDFELEPTGLRSRSASAAGPAASALTNAPAISGGGRCSSLTANPPSPLANFQLHGSVSRRRSFGGSSGGSGGRGGGGGEAGGAGGGGGRGGCGGGVGGMVAEDLDLLCLESKLSLLESQRELNAVRCQRFVDMLRSAERGETAGEEAAASPVDMAPLNGRSNCRMNGRINRCRSASTLLERSCCCTPTGSIGAAGLTAVQAAGRAGGCCASRDCTVRSTHRPNGTAISSASSESADGSPDDSDNASDGTAGGPCSHSWTDRRLLQAPRMEVTNVPMDWYSSVRSPRRSSFSHSSPSSRSRNHRLDSPPVAPRSRHRRLSSSPRPSLECLRLSHSVTNLKALESARGGEIDGAELLFSSPSRLNPEVLESFDGTRSFVGQRRSLSNRASGSSRSSNSRMLNPRRLGSQMSRSFSSPRQLSDLSYSESSWKAKDTSPLVTGGTGRVPSYNHTLPPLISRLQNFGAQSPSRPTKSHTYPRQQQNRLPGGTRSCEMRISQTHPSLWSTSMACQDDEFDAPRDVPCRSGSAKYF